MSDTRTISAKETTINMSDTEAASDTEAMSEEEIGRVVVGGRARAACPQTPKSLKEVKIKKSSVKPQETKTNVESERKEPPPQSTGTISLTPQSTGHSTTKKYTSRMDHLGYRVLHLETDYLTAEHGINSLKGRFDSVERRRDKERDELKRTIKELQDEVISLKRSISETADYVDEKLEKAPKLRKCSHICIEEPTMFEVRRYVFHNLNQHH
ncbi:MAG: hypothetical protein M1839_003237 [Geoglossum umbratile]|nr:MAG: hypothetical protein M1839_003237 [Geoglossum umbratile]